VQPDETDVREIESFYRRHGPALVLYASAITGERSLAQDVVHHVFLRLLENRGLEGVANKKAWLFTCVRNAALNDWKVRQRSEPLDVDMAWFSPPNANFAEEQQLRHALRAIPHDQREVVVMHIWGELTFSEIAEALEISPNTVASRYRYALAKLREELHKKEEASAI
jgi:RNA polymerase sigma-70 factor (ECF subfamily)